MAARHARRCALSETGHLAAVTGYARRASRSEIAGLARGRADLLAQGAGIAAGFHCGRADEARYLRAAQLCIEAGADTGQVQRWAGEGSRRAAITWQQASAPAPPASGPLGGWHRVAGVASLVRRPRCAPRAG